MKKLEEYVRSIPDFPEEGIIFRDITSVLGDADGLHLAVDTMQGLVSDLEFDVVVGPESRGFIFGMPIAYNLRKPFEINVEDGSKKELQPIESDNFTINNDENFLYYVEQKAEQRKYKLYRINLETGEQDCIYKTNKIIVGIVVE